jgi:hypothetical protein
MKKLLLLSALLIGAFVQAQDSKYIKALDTLDNESARIFADQVTANSKNHWEYLRIDETTKSPENYYEVVYIPTDAVDKNKKTKPFVKCDECIKVRFYIYSLGENKDLEIKGARTLRFSDVSGRYLDLFPIWQKVFRPDVTLDKTIEDFKSQQLKIKNPKIDYRFYKKNSDNDWYIHNYS